MIKRFRPLLAFALVIGCLVPLMACGSSSLAQCRIDAVHDAALALPEDESEVSVGMVLDLVRRLSQCRATVAQASAAGSGGSAP
jgi:hypothetical protein